jgi:hypothetical protein
MYDIEQAIRERAYHLWIEGGCQDGHADAHWLAAQRDVLSAALGTIATVSVVDPDVPKKPAKQRKTRDKKARAA